MKRRSLLLAVGAAGVAIVGGGAVFAGTRTPTGALRPWSAVGAPGTGDARLDALRHAVLAPNPHNRQPWLVELRGGDEVLLRCDLGRRLPETDPFDRQITIGFGCFLELCRIAAAERGVRAEIEAFPEGEPAETARLDLRPVARLRFVADPGVERDALYPMIPLRRSLKRPFDTARPLAAGALDELVRTGAGDAAAGASAAPDLVGDLRALTWEAWMIEARTPRTFGESVELMRIGRREIEANPDGISLGGAFIEALALAGQITRTEIGTPGSRAFASGVERYRAMLESAMAYAWIRSETNSRGAQLAAGRAYVRMNLAATRLGIGIHPVSQALQEFPEMSTPFAQVHDRLGSPAPARIQILARLGYGPASGPTPRWPLETRLVGA